MKKRKFFCWLLSLAVLCQCLVMPVLADEEETTEETTAETTEETFPVVEPPTVLDSDASVTHGCHTWDAASALGTEEQLLETAKAAVLYELNSGTMLYEWKADDPVYPASLVKIMTGLLIVEQGDLDRKVTVSRSALNALPMGAMSVEMKAGEVFTMKDLLYCMLVASANDACVVAAEAISGSQELFVKLMNERAAQLGCTGTHFTNSHGIHDELQVTTARDLGKILTKALEYPVFREAFGTPSYVIPETEETNGRELGTTNHFISQDYGVVKFYDKRVTGGKSGSISTSDRSMATTAESGDLNLLSIVMGARGIREPDGYSLSRDGNFEETEDLLEYGFREFEVAQILYEGKAVSQMPVSGGKNHVVGRPVHTVYSALPAGTTQERLVWKYYPANDLTAPVEKGQPVGMVQVWYQTTCLAQSDLVSMNSAQKAPPKTELTSPEEQVRPGGDMILRVMGILFGAILGLFLILILIRLVRTWLLRARRARRRKNRRRSR